MKKSDDHSNEKVLSRQRRLWILFKVLFNISVVSVGGGLTMLPLMTREFVEKRRWMSDEEMVETVAVMQSSPGIIAINMGVLIGYRVERLWGAVIGAFAVALPPFLVILIIASFILHLQGSPMADRVFLGVRSAICAMVLISVIKLSRKVVKGRFELLISVVGFVSLVFFNVNAIWLIIFAGICGVLLSSGGIFSMIMNRQKSRGTK